jgi:hypothetical protein
MTQPASVTSDGMDKVVWVPTLADPANPALSELTAGSVKDLSSYLTDSGWTPGTNEETVNDPRLCSRQVFARAGRFSDTLQLTYVYNILEPTEDVARVTLVHLTEGYIVARWGDDYEASFAADDVVDVYPVQAGVQVKMPPTANTPLMIQQTMHITAPGVQRDVVVAAS